MLSFIRSIFTIVFHPSFVEYLPSVGEKDFTIGELSQRTGFGREAIRFYERKGLLFPSDRSDSGYRLYNEAGINRLQFISQAKLLGFTLRDIQGFIGLRVEDRESCTSVLHEVDVKLQQVRDRADALHRIEKRLLNLQAVCQRTKGEEECSFLSADS